MTKFQKTIVYWSSAALVIIFAVFLLVSINQKLNTAATTNTVSFSGEGKVMAKPDIAMVEFSIITEATTSKAAQDDNSKKSQKVTDFLKKQGIEDKDIKTTSYSIYPKYSYPRPVIYNQSEPSILPPERDGQPKIVGYQVTQSFQVKVRNFDKLSGIVDGLVSVGVNNVNNLGFSVEDLEKLKSEARAKAIADAKKKADELKSQIGIRLGKIVNFSEGFGGYPGIYYAKAEDMGGGDVSGPSLPPGEDEITVNVTLTYQIK
ncbi:MAG: SIMPL domain-containing protein [Candidatus Yanofskybacteria bacterium]|nr:SIMPL domain-containing protein [Candidatus Yanofskybacteria bacterium]